jgi:hypothetical protein
MCPGNHQRAGKRHRGRTRAGNATLRATLVEAAPAAGRRKDPYLAAQCRRLAARRGKKRAAVAVGHTSLVTASSLLRDGTVDQELGPTYFDQPDRAALERRRVARLEALGQKVVLESATSPHRCSD